MSEYRIVFYVGIDDWPWPERRNEQADQILAETFGGSTRQESRGSWRNDSGALEFENSVRFETITTLPERTGQARAREVAEKLRRLYRQNEVLFTIDAVFVGRAKETLARTAEGYLTLPVQPISAEERAILSDELDGGRK